MSDDDRSGFRMNVGNFDPPVSVAADKDVNTFDRAADADVLVKIALNFGPVLGIGLHRTGLALMREHDDQIDLWLEFGYEFLEFRDGITKIEFGDARRQRAR